MTTCQVRSKYLKEGDVLVFTNENGVQSTLYVDDVQYTQDGQIKVSVGHGGTGTEWFEPVEFVTIMG